MGEVKKTLAEKLQEKSLAAKDAVARGAQVVGEGVQKGSKSVAHAVGEGAHQGGQAVAAGAKIAGEGAKKGAQVVKEHPKETALIAGAVVVGAGALPFVPWTAPAAIAAIGAVAAGAKATEDAWQSCDTTRGLTEEGTESAAAGLVAAAEAGAGAADTVMNQLTATKQTAKE